MSAVFDATRVAIVDKVGTNYLVRGNMPLIGSDSHFAYDEIFAASKIPEAPIKKFISISTIDNVSERSSWAAELKAFGVNENRYPKGYWPPYLQRSYNPKALLGSILSTEGKKKQGSVVWWPFEGLPAGEDPKVYLGSPGWNFSGLVDYTIRLLNTSNNLLLYFHCMLGADRTGAAMIGYLMKAKKMSFEAAFTQTSKMTSAGAPAPRYQSLIIAYAEQIKA